MKNETEEKAAELLKSLESHPMMEKIKAEKAAEILEKRIEAKNKIDSLRREEETLIPPLQEKIEAVKKQIAEWEVERKALQERLCAATVELQKEKFRISSEIEREESFLFSSYDLKIDEAIQFFRSKLDDLRKPGKFNSQKMGGRLNAFTLKREVESVSNAAALKQAIYFCMAAIKEIESMRLSPGLDVEKIEALKKNIPDCEIYEEETAERHFKDVADVRERAFLKSDSQIEWELGKLRKDHADWEQGKGRFKKR